jgi:hypothetical protein
VISRDVGQVRDVLRRAEDQATLPRTYPSVQDAVDATHQTPPDGQAADRA